MSHSSDISGEGWFGHGLAITVSQHVEHQASVRLVGELDLASVPVLTACLENLAALDSRYVRADLSGLSFIDCAGLGAILAAHHAFLAQRGTLVIANATSSARRAMRVTGLDDILFITAEAPPFVAVPVA